MAEIADKHYKEHAEDKKRVERSQDYFKANNQRYDDMRDFLYRTTLIKNDRETLVSLQKPPIECNVLEPFISKFCSEWAEQIPDVQVNLAANNLFMKTKFQQAQLVEGYWRNILNSSHYEQSAREIMDDAVSGGFGVWYMYTEYENYKSHRQAIKFKRCDDPRMCFFDPLAKEIHKGDGRYAGELIPKLLPELQEEFPDQKLKLENLKRDQMPTNNDFRWAWQDNNFQDMVYVCNYFYKKDKYETFYEISDPMNANLTHGIFKKEYDQWMEEWDSTMPRNIARPTILKEDRRKVCKIWRKQFVGDVILTKPEETEFESLPYIFSDGNSKVIRGDQITRPLIYNVVDMQRVKNITLSTLVAELESMRQADIMVAQEALPNENQEFMQTWLNPQRAQAAFVHKAYTKDGKQLPEPKPFPRGGLNGELMQFAEQLDMGVQRGLGSYDQQNGMQNAELSGKAIMKGTINSNYAAKPYIDNYLACFNQLLKCGTEVLPKFNKTITTMPIMKADGKRDYVVVNDPAQPENSLDYESTDLNVIVKAGANFDIQRMEALKTIIMLMDKSEGFKAMMEPKGLPIIVDNLDIRGKDQLKQMSEDFVVQAEKKAAAAGNKPDPMQQEIMLQAQKLKLEEKKLTQEGYFKEQEIILKNKEVEAKALDLYRQALISAHDSEVRAKGIEAENIRSASEVAIKFASEFAKSEREDSKHLLDHMKHGLNVYKETKPQPEKPRASA